ncbi:hypothetical protein [Moritella sp. F3]|uniref:hypothetical protein n=1 Tax=Moritella sp. F3 TaxID=2718882 RepID=UPI0018E1BEED|nr:hypothetical protein [Moritella sp. F3]GIC77096.1 hypothetical protein FMO001_18230 [Moritella sp. F1]GIC82215.1 hypothetical protein FMO003_24960 [Moritella sp. F3]
MTIVKLTDFSDEVILGEIGCGRYSKVEVMKAITVIKKTKVKFNHKTGVSTDIDGFVSRYNNYVPEPIEDTLWNEFKPLIMNYCGIMKSRGLAA